MHCLSFVQRKLSCVHLIPRTAGCQRAYYTDSISSSAIHSSHSSSSVCAWPNSMLSISHNALSLSLLKFRNHRITSAPLASPMSTVALANRDVCEPPQKPKRSSSSKESAYSQAPLPAREGSEAESSCHRRGQKSLLYTRNARVTCRMLLL